MLLQALMMILSKVRKEVKDVGIDFRFPQTKTHAKQLKAYTMNKVKKYLNAFIHMQRRSEEKLTERAKGGKKSCKETNSKM